MAQGAHLAHPVIPNATTAAFVAWLVPAKDLEYVVNDLCRKCKSNLSHAATAIRWAARRIVSQLWPAFNFWKSCVWALAFAAAFARAPKNLAYVLAIVSGLVGMAIVDAHLHPKRYGPIQEGYGAMAALAFVFTVQAFETWFLPDLALPANVMSQGLAWGMVTVSAARAKMRWPKDPEPQKPASFNMARFIVILWVVAAYICLITSGLPELPHQGAWLGPLFITMLLIAFVLTKDAIGGLFDSGFVTILQDNARQKELERKLKYLVTHPSKKPVGFPWPRFFEILGFLCFCVPLGAILWQPSGVDRAAFIAYLAGCVSLAVLWVFIRRMNQRTALALIAEAKAKGDI